MTSHGTKQNTQRMNLKKKGFIKTKKLWLEHCYQQEHKQKYPINLDISLPENPIITKENAYVKEDFDDYITILKKVQNGKLSSKNLETVINFFEDIKNNHRYI